MMLGRENTIAYLFLLALIVGFITFAVLLGQKESKKTTTDYTIVSDSGTITKIGENDYALVINNADTKKAKRIMAFTDRPVRDAVYVPDDFINQFWKKGKTFEEDPPNAVVVINGFQQPVILKSIKYFEATDTTTFKLAADDIPIEATGPGECQIFIDGVPTGIIVAAVVVGTLFGPLVGAIAA